MEGKKAEGKKAGGTKEGIEKAYNHTYTLQQKGKLENICDGDVSIFRGIEVRNSFSNIFFRSEIIYKHFKP